ncbi:MAG TPA: MMPL family transporter [Mycobacterium sp.]|mgnify:CR=1 FL=1|nr:MMPL family transporter [Mycobacterium sp.]
MIGHRVATIIRRLCVPIFLFWLGLAALTNTSVPLLEKVAEAHNVALSAQDAPSMIAMRHIGKVFKEFDSDSSAMIVLEGDKPLGAEAHAYYDALMAKLSRDTTHIVHIQNFWGDPLTAAGAQSPDGKASFVQVYLAGNQGEGLSDESVRAVRAMVADSPPPPGIKAFVAGPGPLVADQFDVGSKGSKKVTMVTFAVIFLMLLWVYRSISTVLLVLVMVLLEVASARGVVAVLAQNNVIGLSVYSTNLLTLLSIAAGTDYAIFLLGRYHEARHAGEGREEAFYTSYIGTSHVVLGSGLTIVGALYCLTFTRLPYFNSLGVPAAIGITVALLGSLSLAPAIVTMGSHFGLFDPKRAMRTQGWRRIGTAIVRWPGPILVVSIGIALIGLLALPGYKTSYNVRSYLPPSSPANVGYDAAERHFSAARLNPELLMIESDHDLRNPASMLVLEKVAKAVFHTPGVALVQSITRPLGTPLDHTSLGFQMGMQGSVQLENLPFQQARADDLAKQVAEITNSIDLMKRQYAAQQQLSAATDEQAQVFHETVDTINDLRDKIADVDDFLRPIRSYFYWEPHCFDIPLCASFRSLFDALDGVDKLSNQFDSITGALDKLTAVQPELLALIPQQIASQERNRSLVESAYSTQSGLLAQSAESLKNADAMGKAFDEAKDDSTFYLPPDVFTNSEFKRGLTMFVSPDGHAARMIITHEGDPATPDGISHIPAIEKSAREALKGTPLAGSHIYLAGTASTYRDIQQGAKYDLLIAGISALSLILLIMMFVTRSLVAALVIVGTVALSLGASFGLSVLVWQNLFGIELYWIVQALAVILLLAVGSDYNLLLISRFKEEIGAGLNTGIIRAMGSTGAVVTAAGLVFAATMGSFIFSNLRVLGQIGTTIGLGLLFDTLIVRSFMTPAVAALLGRWFWWPLKVRPRPASEMLRPYGTRKSVRELLDLHDH